LMSAEELRNWVAEVRASQMNSKQRRSSREQRAS